jgi:hypothetical protein
VRENVKTPRAKTCCVAGESRRVQRYAADRAMERLSRDESLDGHRA